MMFQLGDDGVVSAVNENDLIYVDKNELDELVDRYNCLKEENEQLKSDNFNLNKSVECLDKIVKEQYNKINWAEECGVRWDEEYNEWIR